MIKSIASKIVAVANALDGAGMHKLARDLDSVLESIAVRPKLLEVPDIRQFNNYSCGSACLMAILGYWGLYEGNEKLLGKILGTNYKDGTSPEAIAKVAQRFGLGAEIKENCELEDLEQAIKNKQPPIANFQAWSESEHPDYKHNESDGHYAIVVGIDKDRVYFRDPSIYNKIGVLSKKSFLERWHDGRDSRRAAIFFDGKSPAQDDEFEEID